MCMQDQQDNKEFSGHHGQDDELEGGADVLNADLRECFTKDCLQDGAWQ